MTKLRKRHLSAKLVSQLVSRRRTCRLGRYRTQRPASANSSTPALPKAPQLVTRRGAEAAVLVPVDEWRRLQASARPSLKQLLLADEARAELVLPARGKARRRTPVALR